MDKSVIPKGVYCYDDKGICPYWSIAEDAEEQENGYCKFLGKGDREFNQENEDDEILVSRNGVHKTMKMKDLAIGFSLLWDQCKECEINMEDEDGEDSTYS